MLPAAKKILIVEDDKDLSDIMALKLASEGFEPIQVFDTSQLIGQLDTGLAAVLLDVTIPGLDGIEICKLIRERSDTKKLPVVFLSGHSSARDIALALKAQADAYFIKPIEFKHIIKKINQLLGETPSETLSVLVYAKDSDHKSWIKNLFLCLSFNCLALSSWDEIQSELANREYDLLVLAEPTPAVWLERFLHDLNQINAGRAISVIGLNWNQHALPTHKNGKIAFACLAESDLSEIENRVRDIVSRAKLSY